MTFLGLRYAFLRTISAFSQHSCSPADYRLARRECGTQWWYAYPPHLSYSAVYCLSPLFKNLSQSEDIMFKGPTYKASFYFQQQLFLKVLRQCSKSFGGQNTIKVFCHPSQKKKKNIQVITLTAESTLVSDLIYEKKNLTPLPELTMYAHALIV